MTGLILQFFKKIIQIKHFVFFLKTTNQLHFPLI